MKPKAIEILIVVAVLFAIAFVVGCEDERYIEFVQESCQHEGLQKSAMKLWKCQDCGEFVSSEERSAWNTSSNYLITIDANSSDPNNLFFDWEPDYPTTTVFGICNDSSKEATFEIGQDHEMICGSTREEWLNIWYESMSGKTPTEKVTLRFKEPELLNLGLGGNWCKHNYLESIDDYWGLSVSTKKGGTLTHREYRCLDCGFDITIAVAVADKPVSEPEEPNEPLAFDPSKSTTLDIMSIIPTWPDYIELPADLRAFPPDDNDSITIGECLVTTIF